MQSSPFGQTTVHVPISMSRVDMVNSLQLKIKASHMYHHHVHRPSKTEKKAEKKTEETTHELIFRTWH